MKYLFTYTPKHVPEFHIETIFCQEPPAWIKELEEGEIIVNGKQIGIYPDREPCLSTCTTSSCEACPYECHLCG